ncbi:MAG: aminoacyl-tRNA deacylase [Candidatus Hodarchaeota archaeon]
MSITELEEYLKKQGVQGTFHHFSEHTMTVAAAVNQLGISSAQIIKSMIFIDAKGHPILAIVPGNRRVSEKKLSQIRQVPFVRRATPDEVIQITGYSIGAVPPVGHKQALITYIDPLSMEFPTVIGGGGATNALLEMSPKDVQRLTDAQVHNISK